MLNDRTLPGVTFEDIVYTPKSIEGMATSPKYQDQACGGVRLMIMDREIFQPIQTAAVMIHLIRENYPHQFEWREGHFQTLFAIILKAAGTSAPMLRPMLRTGTLFTKNVVIT
jgi:uncharacterized protein YbbC (DUF1343 family)